MSPSKLCLRSVLRTCAAVDDVDFLSRRQESAPTCGNPARRAGIGRPRAQPTSGPLLSLLLAERRQDDGEDYCSALVHERSTCYCAGFAVLTWGYERQTPALTAERDTALLKAPDRTPLLVFVDLFAIRLLQCISWPRSCQQTTWQERTCSSRSMRVWNLFFISSNVFSSLRGENS